MSARWIFILMRDIWAFFCVMKPLIFPSFSAEVQWKQTPMFFYMCVSSAILATCNCGCFDGVLGPESCTDTAYGKDYFWPKKFSYISANMFRPHALHLHVVFPKYERYFWSKSRCVFLCYSELGHGYPPLGLRCGGGSPSLSLCVPLQVLHLYWRWV